MGTVDITIAMPCAQCGGRRYIGGFLCGACNGNGAMPITLRRWDPRRTVLLYMGIALLATALILGAVLYFAR